MKNYKLINSGGLNGEWYIQRKTSIWVKLLILFK